ncbi:MAG: hypothetical protein QOG21_1733 [Actinomycetota bacterium]|jgi:hypothetical protein|nr:hypothetical protein [Actinomycetota bacterium]
MKRSIVALAVVALALALAGPAAAKGAIPQSAQMTGPGLDKPMTFGNGLGGSSHEGNINTLANDAKLFQTLSEGDVLANVPASNKLGPRYKITWTMRPMFQEGKTFKVRSDLYPYAKQGPVIHTFGGPKMNAGGFVLHTGWALTNPVLADNLHAWGLPKDPRRAAGKVAASAIAPLWAILVGLFVLVGAAIVSVRRKTPPAAVRSG